MKYFKERNVNFYTYQLKYEKSYRTIIKYLHHTTPIDCIIEELKSKSFLARNLTNIFYGLIKVPFFFVNLELSLTKIYLKLIYSII